MCASKPSTKESFIKRACRRLFRKEAAVPPELQQAINECTTMQELIELLFATDFILDEAMIAAFDQRIDELEQGHTLSVFRSLNPKLKTYNNGNRTV